MKRTIKVVIQTSFHVGQVILATSCRTPCIEVIGLNFAIKLLSARKCDNLPQPSPRVIPGPVGRTNQNEVPRLRWQGRRGSNPRPSVLETDALPIELHPFNAA